MILPPTETERFYHIWWPLLSFVNEQRQLFPDWPKTPAEGKIETAKALQVRDVLWADDTLREAFIAENPGRLEKEDLAQVAAWQRRVAGEFYVFRHLKKYTIFLSESPTRAYGVLGLVSPIADVIPMDPPVLAKAVLLPWRDTIIYDGLISPYSVYFGSGIRADLNQAYRDAQEREGVITSLLPLVPEDARKGIRARNAKILGAFRTDLAGSGLSVKMIEQHAGNLEAFAETYLLEQDPPRGLLDLQQNDIAAYLGRGNRSAGDAKTAVISFKRYMRFLLNTGRMHPETAWDLLDYLKTQKG